jgi:Mg-chelatase subunit ChlD
MKPYLLIALLALLGFSGPKTSWAQDALETEKLSQSGLAITIVFDDSGSMSENNKMEQAKAAFTQWLSGVPPETKLGLVALNKGVLVPLGMNTREQVKNAVAAMSPGGGTPLGNTIIGVGNLIMERRANVTPYERQIVVVFTDGQDQTSAEHVQNALNGLRKATIESVGIGFHGQGDYMRNGATQYYNATDGASLVAALKEVGSEIDQQSDVVMSPEIEAALDGEKTQAPAPSSPQTSALPPTEEASLPMPILIIVGAVAVILVLVLLSMFN